MISRQMVVGCVTNRWLLAAILAAAYILTVGLAYAQQATPQDHMLNAYQQLLTEANTRIVGLSAKVQMLEAEAAKRKAEDGAAAKAKEK